MTDKKTPGPMTPEFWQNLPVKEMMTPEFWRNFPIEEIKKLLKTGMLIPTDQPGVYYFFKEVTLPNKPEGTLLS